MKILITGGAGYIGSIVTEQLIEDGKSVVALDNLKQGHREAVLPGAAFVQIDLANLGELDYVFRHYQMESVIHLAADSLVGDSMNDPKGFFQNNVINSVNLLDTMLKHGVYQIIFSSSAAVYGEPQKIPIEENDVKEPINPYGESKAMFERILHWYGQAYGFRAVSLRYFNAAGASERFGEDHNPETHLIPNILKVALGQVDEIPIFGSDYPTRDGSCIRDYIHVVDIAEAHILAMKSLEKGHGFEVYNLGNSEGYSVIEVIEMARKVTEAEIPTVIRPRRPGDPAVLVASSELAESRLGWHPEFSDINSIIESAWQWQKKYPHGYNRKKAEEDG